MLSDIELFAREKEIERRTQEINDKYRFILKSIMLEYEKLYSKYRLFDDIIDNLNNKLQYELIVNIMK